MRFYTHIILAFLTIMYSCSSETPFTPPEENNSYIKIFTADSANIKFEVYSKTASFFMTGYNEIAFKVFEDNQPKNSGFVKFFPKMYHFIGSPYHSSPTSAQYEYDGTDEMFKGYVCFLMATDTSGSWTGLFNYNNQITIDSFPFVVNLSTLSQTRLFTDYYTAYDYFITLIKPLTPTQGPNTFQCILHRSNNDINFYRMDSVEMYIKPWMETMGHGSTNNQNPVHIGNGIYEGLANFNMPGNWFVYDSIKYQGRFITPTPPPKFIFDVP